MSVTISELRAHVRAPATDDALLSLYAEAAWEYVRVFTRREWPDTEPLPAAVRTAVLMLVADLYENREAQGPVQLHVNKTADRLLWAHRQF